MIPNQPVGDKLSYVFIEKQVQKADSGKLGGKVTRIQYAPDGSAISDVFAVAIESNKTYHSTAEIKQSFFDKVYKKITGHDRWIPIQIGTAGNGKPLYVKANYNSLRERIFKGNKEELDSAIKNEDGLKNKMAEIHSEGTPKGKSKISKTLIETQVFMNSLQAGKFSDQTAEECIEKLDARVSKLNELLPIIESLSDNEMPTREKEGLKETIENHIARINQQIATLKADLEDS